MNKQESAPPQNLVQTSGTLIAYLVLFHFVLGGLTGIPPSDPIFNPFVLYCATIALFGLAWLALALTGFWRRWLFWRLPPDETVGSSVVSALTAWAALTASFAAITTELWRVGLLTTKAGVASDFKYGTVELYYIWHFLSAIPALDVPKTLNWTLQFGFADYFSGALLLVYKLLVIVPVIGLLKAILPFAVKGNSDGAPKPAR
jgi:hypothetical protein